MKKLLIIFLFSFNAYADPLEDNKFLIDWTETKFKEVYQVEYQEIGVLYIVNKKGALSFLNNEKVLGYFTSFLEKDMNMIFIEKLDNVPLERSILVHELSHFFTKKAIFKHGINLRQSNMPMLEAIAMHIQNLYLEEFTGKGLLAHEGVKETCELSENFTDLYKTDLPLFLCNAVNHFKINAPEKFNKFKNTMEKGWVITLKNH